MGTTGFSSSGILSSGTDIRSSSVGVGLKRSRLFNGSDSLTLGVSRPLGINGGSMVIDAPVSFAAAENGRRSSTVNRDRSEIALAKSNPPADIQLGYSRDLGAGQLSLGGVWRSDPQARDAYALAAGFSLAF